MTDRLPDFHSGDRAQFYKLLFRTGMYVIPLLFVGEALAWSRGWIGPGTLFVLAILNFPVVYIYCAIQFWMMSTVAEGFTKMVLAGGNLPPDPAHSRFEALEVRGRYADAAEAWRDHLVAKPRDHLARIKLADLCLRHLDRPDAAERLYLEIRQGQPTPREERLATNLLMELYRKTGRKDRLMVELARFANQHKGTRASQEATRVLLELKQELPRE